MASPMLNFDLLFENVVLLVFKLTLKFTKIFSCLLDKRFSFSYRDI
jgi:hypothetical protein